MSRFLNTQYQTLSVYVPGEQPQDMPYIKLNTNESPYPPSPQVLKAVGVATLEDLRLYPDPTCAVLAEKLATLYRVNPENIFLSNGSDDILQFAFLSLCPCGAIFPDITYGFYPVFADLHSIPYTKIPLNEDFTLDISAYFGVEKTIFIANPNAPTGLYLNVSQIEQIVQKNPDNVVVVDEAYIDFGGESCIPLIKQYDNLLVCATFSKSRSMAGARLGFAVANQALLEDLNKIKYATNPYAINRMTLTAGEAAVDSNAYFMGNCKKIIQTRAYTTKGLQTMGFQVLDSKANFIFAKKEGICGAYLYQKLKQEGILIRHFDKDRIAAYNRITIGTMEQMEHFLFTVKKIIGR